MPLKAQWKVNEFPKYAYAIREAERRNGIPPEMLARQLAKETNNFDADIIAGKGYSEQGALGIAKLMPDTAKRYGLQNRRDPFASIEVAAKYLRDLQRRFGRWEYALAAYNWGVSNTRRWLAGDTGNDGVRVQPPPDTREYLATIKKELHI